MPKSEDVGPEGSLWRQWPGWVLAGLLALVMCAGVAAVLWSSGSFD